MFKSNSKLFLPLIAGVAVAGVAGTFWFGGMGNNAQTVGNNSQAMAMSSVWDKETEPNYSGVKEVTVYRSPNCGCCGEWVKHMQKHGFKIKDDIKTEDMEAIKQKYNVPQNLASCHTSIIDGYVMEGHIPADDIKRFVASKPKQAGLAVPAMPLGSPGMESVKKQPFAIASFNKDGEIKIFKEYQSY